MSLFVGVETHSAREVELEHKPVICEFMEGLVHGRERDLGHLPLDSDCDYFGKRVGAVADKCLHDSPALRGHA
jgi:hypothetical protein